MSNSEKSGISVRIYITPLQVQNLLERKIFLDDLLDEKRAEMKIAICEVLRNEGVSEEVLDDLNHDARFVSTRQDES